VYGVVPKGLAAVLVAKGFSTVAKGFPVGTGLPGPVIKGFEANPG